MTNYQVVERKPTAEELFEKFGFWKRPTEHYGHGMIQFWKKAGCRPGV